ncbi:MAG: DUF6473 family protein [Sulfitobacter sp.]
MTYDVLGPGALDYLPCRYGTSKLLFRGPKRPLDKPYVAFLGGTETYGKFIANPFAELVEKEIGVPCVNLGYLNAGIDVFVHDPFITSAAGRADVTVVQIVGAQNLTNRFYSVHPRRNDRFVSASPLLKTIFAQVDFADFHFNKHMLSHLQMVSPERFETVIDELQQAWIARMRLMLGQISGKIVLLWLSGQTPDQAISVGQDGLSGLGADPLFVTRKMMGRIAPLVTEVVEVVATRRALCAGTQGMVYSQMEEPAAEEMLGPLAHEEAAMALAPIIKRLC